MRNFFQIFNIFNIKIFIYKWFKNQNFRSNFWDRIKTIWRYINVYCSD